MSNIDKIISSLPVNKTAALVTQNYSESRFYNRLTKKEAIIQRLNDVKKHLTSLKTSTFTTYEERKKVALEQMDLENQLRMMKKAIKTDNVFLAVFYKIAKKNLSKDVFEKILNETKSNFIVNETDSENVKDDDK